MARLCKILGFGVLLLAIFPGIDRSALAGDEDVKQQEKTKVENAAPADTPVPSEPEAPGLSMEGEEPSPEFADAPLTSPAAKSKKPMADLDTNIDYSLLLGIVEPADAPRGVNPPAEGFRGYRPNMVAITVGDRSPGYGALVEYSWNRIGAGVYGAYRPLLSNDYALENYQTFGGIYGLYRFLPWGISPYFLLGMEVGFNTDESVGGLTGGGIEARIYSGWTALVGWTYHSTVHRGFLGGAFGWSF